MTEEKRKKLFEILEQRGMRLVGGIVTDPSMDGGKGGIVGIHFSIPKGSSEALALEAAGFGLIYPEAPNEEDLRITNYSRYGSDKKAAEYTMGIIKDNEALVVDMSQEDGHSLRLASAIYRHMHQLRPTKNSIAMYNDKKFNWIGHNTPNDSFYGLMKKLGYEPQIGEDGSLTVTGDVPYQFVPPTKFEKMYNEFKDRIRGFFDKISSSIGGRGQNKDNNQYEPPKPKTVPKDDLDK